MELLDAKPECQILVIRRNPGAIEATSPLVDNAVRAASRLDCGALYMLAG